MMISSNRGFTLIELVMVLVLIGILSAGVTSLFASRGGFSVFVAKDQLISSSLLAQQISLAYQSAPTPSSLTINLTGGNWIFQVTKSGSVDIVSNHQTETAGAMLSVIRSDSVVKTLPLTLSWDRQGNMSPRFGYTFKFSGENTAKVCLSSAGFAYELTSGNCP